MTKEDFLQILLVNLKDDLVGDCQLVGDQICVCFENAETFCVTVEKK